MGHVTIVGLGPGSPDLLTREALDVLSTAPEIYLRTTKRPFGGLLPRRTTVVSFDDVFEGDMGDGKASDVVADRILSLADRPEGVIYAVPGHPSVGDSSVQRIRQRATEQGCHVRIVAGISIVDVVFERLGLDPFGGDVRIVDAARIAQRHAPDDPEDFDPFSGCGRTLDPTVPALIFPVHGGPLLIALKRALQVLYPRDHPVSVVRLGEAGNTGNFETRPLTDLDGIQVTGVIASVYLKPVERLTDVTGFDTLRYIVARLRAPDGCPWDREQSHQSMKKHFIEETYEAIAALDEENWEKFAEELGDVLLQVVMHGQLGHEAREFDLEDVLRAVNEKLIRRHPHVFGDVKVGSSADVLRNWERIKRAENGTTTTSFSNIPQSIPALMRADAIQSRAMRYGWSPPDGLPDVYSLEKPGLESDDFKRRLGKILFELVTVARQHRVDPEEALRVVSNQFAERLEQVLTALVDVDPSFDQLPVDERRRRVVEAMRKHVGIGTQNPGENS